MILKVLLERLSLPFPLKLHICVSVFFGCTYVFSSVWYPSQYSSIRSFVRLSVRPSAIPSISQIQGIIHHHSRVQVMFPRRKTFLIGNLSLSFCHRFAETFTLLQFSSVSFGARGSCLFPKSYERLNVCHRVVANDKLEEMSLVAVFPLAMRARRRMIITDARRCWSSSGKTFSIYRRRLSHFAFDLTTHLPLLPDLPLLPASMDK